MEKKEQNRDHENRDTCHVDKVHDPNANETQSLLFQVHYTS